ncbi:hypothetical protein [Pseudomonas sp. PH1b]|uniref:hypothetical protein n=1 Tax=Pseudomonas sp. PH1b TaxID=1397282 RepID=UPI0012FEC5B7|nr:hypothetical protein [Pseudomonas sp. PH1b]
MRTDNLPFAARNAEDYEQVTKSIELALTKIRDNPDQPASKTNLARIANVHRNTLTFRARSSISGSSSAVASLDDGWPFSELKKIKVARKKQVTVVGDKKYISSKGEVYDLTKRLAKARYVAGSWFHRFLEAKENLVDVNLRLQRVSDYYSRLEIELRESRLEVTRLRYALRQTIKSVD